jgi:hypothetical protein
MSEMFSNVNWQSRGFVWECPGCESGCEGCEGTATVFLPPAPVAALASAVEALDGYTVALDDDDAPLGLGSWSAEVDACLEAVFPGWVSDSGERVTLPLGSSSDAAPAAPAACERHHISPMLVAWVVTSWVVFFALGAAWHAWQAV